MTVLSLAVGCTSRGGPGPAPKVRLDHSTAAPVAALADAAPAPGSLGESWHVDLGLSVDHYGKRESPQPPLLLNGQLVLASSRGLDVYDANTGKERWHYHEPGRTLRGYAATAGVLVLLTSTPEDVSGEPRGRRVGLEAGTGRVLWTGSDKDDDGFSLGSSDELVAGGGVVPMTKRASDDNVFGVDARTGRTRWSHDHVAGKGCEANALRNRSNDGGLLVFRATCHGRVRVLAIDPATGRERWSKDVSDEADPATAPVSVSGGMTLLSYATGFRLITADGRDLGRVGDFGCSLTCDLRVTAGHAVVAYLESGGVSFGRMMIVDTRTGQRTTPRVSEAYSAMTLAGGRVYGAHQHLFASGQTELLPAGLDVIDPATGTVQPRPLPFATKKYGAEPGGSAVGWLAVAGGRLYTRRLLGGTVRVTSYTTAEPGEPAALGGVSPADWPDACRLVPGAKAMDRPRAVTIGTTTLHDVACTVPVRAITTLETAWVAASPEQAHALLAEPKAAARPHVDGADETFSGGSSEYLLIRVGRSIVRIDNLDERDRIQVAATVARALRKR